jgi:hypothetical protein
MSGTCKNRLHSWSLSIADDACFVSVFAGEADVLCRSSVPDWNGAISTAATSDDLTTVLGSVVFVGEAALRLRFDFEGHLRITEFVKLARQRAAASA